MGSTGTRGKIIESIFGSEFEQGLIEEIRPIAVENGVRPQALAAAIEEAFFEVEQTKRDAAVLAEEHRSHLLSLILWKVFAKGSELWITSRTAAGNRVPLNLLVTAYTMWKRAVSLAADCGVCSVDAAVALAQMTHATADQLARSNRDGERNHIRSVEHYLFAAFMYSVFRIAGKQGWKPADHVVLTGSMDWSDEGSFQRAMESSILCRELLDVMQPKGRRVAIARYFMGYGWQETAEILKSSVNAAQKAQSIGLRRAYEACMRQFGKFRRPKANVKIALVKGQNLPSDGE